ncbi:MAG: hypothetical protein WA746_13540 [Isosphaeraceae bacterium]
MSDMSSLSHEHASSADFSRQINDAVLLLKRRYLGAGSQSFEEGKLVEALAFLQRTVKTLLDRLAEDVSNRVSSGEPIPEDVLARIEAQHRGEAEYFRQDLTRVQELLSTQASLNREELDLLDSICQAADASASATFRKLWRR